MPAPATSPQLPEHAVVVHAVQLHAEDGRKLAASWTQAQAGTPSAITVIHAAVGVPSRFYDGFARWLAARGHGVLRYDYRGIAGSRQGALRDESARLREWAVLDMSAAIAEARRRCDEQRLPLLQVGHSFGGNCLAFARGVETSDALLLVASQIPVLQHFPGWRKGTAWAFFRHWVPLVTRLRGYLPGWANGGGESLPRGVALQWCDWGLRDAWAFSDHHMSAHNAAPAIRAPVHLWSVSDDLQYAPPRAVDALATHFPHAAVQRHDISPQALGLRRLGHFGAFRRSAGAQLWPLLLAPLEAAVPALAPH